jgi:hypothetical protein
LIIEKVSSIGHDILTPSQAWQGAVDAGLIVSPTLYREALPGDGRGDGGWVQMAAHEFAALCAEREAEAAGAAGAVPRNVTKVWAVGRLAVGPPAPAGSSGGAAGRSGSGGAAEPGPGGGAGVADGGAEGRLAQGGGEVEVAHGGAPHGGGDRREEGAQEEGGMQEGGGLREEGGTFAGRSDVVAVSVVGTEREVAALLVATSSVLRGLPDWPLQV